ncbi:MAG: helix-turn-helix domain-containing protein [Faecalibacterium prausnitzii]
MRPTRAEWILFSSAREAVARMLKSFSEDGLVELKRGAITLRDKNRLNRLK